MKNDTPRYDNDPVQSTDWDEEAYNEAKRAWQAWEASQEAKKKGKTQLSEKERLARDEQCHDIIRRHYEAKERRRQAMENDEEIWDDETCDGYDDETRTKQEECRGEEPARAPWTAWEVYKYILVLFVIFMVLFSLFLSMGEVVGSLLD